MMGCDSGQLTCPHCGETFEISVDPSEGKRQSWISDCEVCCRPLSVRVTIGKRSIEIDADPA